MELNGENSWTVALWQIKCCTLQYLKRNYNFYLNNFFLRNFWIWRRFENLRLCLNKRWTALWRFYNFVQCHIFQAIMFLFLNVVYLFNWYDNGIILEPQFKFMVYLSKVFWILEIPTQRPKSALGYIGL
jgi:hypothetical protein